MWTIGIFIGAVFTGGLITSGIACIFFLSTKNSMPRQSRCLQIYVIFLILMVLAFDTLVIITSNETTIFCVYTEEQAASMYDELGGFDIIFTIAVAALTDGILVRSLSYDSTSALLLLTLFFQVWRCFMIQRVLGRNPSWWGNLFWVFPTCLWCITMCTCKNDSRKRCTDGLFSPATSVTSIFYSTLTANGLQMASNLTAAAFVSNAVMNIYATTFLTSRLLSYRRMSKICFGEKAHTAHHIHLVNIFLQSAAINVPMSICAAVGLSSEKTWGSIISVPAVASQVSLPLSWETHIDIYDPAIGVSINTDHPPSCR
jgi:hypothetical protein